MEVILTPAHIAEFYNLNKDLYAFVQDGLRGPDGKQATSLGKLFGNVAQYMFHYMDVTKEPLPSDQAQAEPGEPTKPGKPNCRPLTLAEIAYDRYAQFVGTKVFPDVRRYGLAPVGPVAPEIQERGAIACNLPVLKVPDAMADDNLLRAAWLTARKNKIRAWQRMGAVLFLAHQTMSDMDDETRAELETEGSVALEHLHHRAEVFTASELKFAILLGGEALETTRKDLVDGELTTDGFAGRYLFKDEQPADTVDVFEATKALRAELPTFPPAE